MGLLKIMSWRSSSLGKWDGLRVDQMGAGGVDKVDKRWRRGRSMYCVDAGQTWVARTGSIRRIRVMTSTVATRATRVQRSRARVGLTTV